jgi:hypothetical protein
LLLRPQLERSSLAVLRWRLVRAVGFLAALRLQVRQQAV